MAFARALWRGKFKDVSLVRFMVFVKLVTKKGGTPFAFVFYRYTAWHDESAEDLSEMVYFELKDAELSWLLPGAVEKERNFPDYESAKWKKTTPWLYSVTVESSSLDGYVKVSHRPRPRRKKVVKVCKNVRVLSVEQILSREEQKLLFLKEEVSGLRNECAALEVNEGGRISVPKGNQSRHAFLLRRIVELETAIQSLFRKKSRIDPAFLRPVGRILGSVRQVLTSH